MTSAEIIDTLETLGTPGYRTILMRHGAQEPDFGVKIAELKKLQKQIRMNRQLSCELFRSGIYDAQYLAGLIADGGRMTWRELKSWLARCNCPTIATWVVAPVASESAHGWDLALEWIASTNENTAQTGWATLASLVSVTDDADLNQKELKRLVRAIPRMITREVDPVRYAMNNFVIAAGCYVASLTDDALAAADAIGTVEVDMGQTACRVPSAREAIEKVRKRGALGTKRRSAMC